MELLPNCSAGDAGMQSQCSRNAIGLNGNPSPEQFVLTWQQSTTLREVAKKLRMERGACRVRASRYRRQGVPLKELAEPLDMLPLDWHALAKYAADVLNGTAE
jgi:hypothetical protein